MQQRDRGQQQPQTNSLDNPGRGGQGIDKAPGDETAQDNVNFKEETQKGKKVDADLSQESERPIDQDIY